VFVAFNLLVWIGLCGGLGEFSEVLEPHWQPDLVWPPAAVGDSHWEATCLNWLFSLVCSSGHVLPTCV
jgi:hypothetical protein